MKNRKEYSIWAGKVIMARTRTRKRQARIVFDLGEGIKVSFPVKKKKKLAYA